LSLHSNSILVDPTGVPIFLYLFSLFRINLFDLFSINF
jgi:hypothetical protein